MRKKRRGKTNDTSDQSAVAAGNTATEAYCAQLRTPAQVRSLCDGFERIPAVVLLMLSGVDVV